MYVCVFHFVDHFCVHNFVLLRFLNYIVSCFFFSWYSSSLNRNFVRTPFLNSRIITIRLKSEAHTKTQEEKRELNNETKKKHFVFLSYCWHFCCIWRIYRTHKFENVLIYVHFSEVTAMKKNIFFFVVFSSIFSYWPVVFLYFNFFVIIKMFIKEKCADFLLHLVDGVVCVSFNFKI